MTNWTVAIPNHLKTQEMCNEAVRINSLLLAYVLDRFKTQEMCNDAAEKDLYMLRHVPDHFWPQEMLNEIMRTMPDAFYSISDHFKTQEMCDKAVKEDSFSLEYVPDWFVTQEQIGLWDDKCYEWYDDGKDRFFDDDDEDNPFDWYEGYQKRKVQKASIKEELMLIAWHPSRWRDWCMSED